jgi:hypothetical protein
MMMLNSSDNVSSRPLDSSWVWSQPWDPPAQGVSQFDGGQGGSDGACRLSDILQGRSEGLTFHNACESCSPVYVDENGARREHQSPDIRCMICIFDEEKIFSHLFAFGPQARPTKRLRRVVMFLPVGRVIQTLPCVSPTALSCLEASLGYRSSHVPSTTLFTNFPHPLLAP